MPTPTSGSSYSSVSLPSVTTVDALLIGTKWGSTGAGNGVTVSYSFPTATSTWSTNSSSGYGPVFGSGEPWSSSYAPLNSTQQQAFRSALQAWANVANIQFSEVTETSSLVGDIRVAFTSLSSSYSAWAYYPQSGAKSGDVWLNVAESSNNNPSVGSFGFMTMMHELGHALGLKHSFEAEPDNSTVMPSAYESRRYTVMSYTDAVYANAEPSTPMLYDIQAIQYLYGANTSYNTGNNTYSYSNSVEVMETIWDAGGNDTLDAGNQTLNVTLDLRAGHYSSIGIRSGGVAAVDNVAIAFNVTIENAVGGSGHDLIYGNEAANVLTCGNGDDTIYTMGGNDTVYGGSGGDTVHLGDAGGTVLLSGIEAVVGGAGFDLVTVDANALHVSGAVDALIGAGTAEVVTLQDGGLTLIVASLETLIGGSGTDRANLGNRGNTTVVSGMEIVIGSLNTDVITLSDIGATITASRLETLIGGSGTDRVNLGNLGSTTVVSGMEIVIGSLNTDVITLSDIGATITASRLETLIGGSGTDRVNLGNLGSTTVVSGMEIIIGSLNTDVITLSDAGNTFIASRLETLIGGSGTDRVNLGNLGSTTVLFGIEDIVGSLNTDLITLGAAVQGLRIQGVETLSGSFGDDGVTVALGGGMTFQGGAGADALTLTTAAAMDVVEFSSAADGAGAGASIGFDQIFNFQSGTDVVGISGSLRSSLDRDGNGTLTAVARGTNGIVSGRDELVVLNGSLSSLADTELATVRAAVGTVTGGVAAPFLLIGNDTVSTGLYLVSDGGDGSIGAADIRLLATFSGSLLSASDIRLV
ncbi:Ca2+-binding RTX toxin-like protein [Azospirillum fermentarium]|uniref:M10 family metallopeptidase n=1 Tax=Azospirillum fermentarium TaxID=1233114 RepID=UPI002227ABE6|nr:M10 family metallopeptidase [Azospirillum fermentarium]MCW2249474.1 Ca2+-binding RTX toxin-like protein [Azospirillum fermentarium]